MTEKEAYKKLREDKRLGLQNFPENITNNHFDISSDKLIEELELKISELKSQIESYNATPGYIKSLEIYFIEKELLAFSEMKIIYAHKHFETHLKFLLSSSYEEVEEKRLYKWAEVENLLKSKDINLKNISNYSEISELRNLNNAIKHSRNMIDVKTKHILELRNKKEPYYKDLLEFYNRIEGCSLIFLTSLSKEIEKNLFEFENEQLEKISVKLVSHMDPPTVSKLINKLESKSN
ncbi:hypothetical protein BC962_0846 [Gillisia mitskevichiae]|uniref:Cthe-2314-like HEPN domain-containing protein n=1 Tax=Gillisia mitskevichiae TaxID=270921 RepID=A0A495PZC9_9FLAO|nr:hypothetical protein [Gillisia mitskevichiae]RKS55873.1 hypothetical protein BC962_0846 [Gillisia mitskevichiae]